MLGELVDDAYEGGIRGGVVEPEAARRNIDGDLRGGAAFTEHVADTVDMGGEGGKAGIAVKAAARPCSAHAHVFDAADAFDQKVIENPTGFLEVGLRIIGRKSLGHRPRVPVQMRRRGGQLGKIGHHIVPDLVPDGVHAGHLDAAHALEEIAVGYGEPRQDFLVLDVRLHLDTILRAPFAFHAEEVLAEEIRPHVGIVRIDAVALVEIDAGWRSGSAPADTDGGNLRQVGTQVITFALLELGQERGRPGVEAEGRLVAPEAQDRLSEFAADGLLVGIEGPLDEEFVRLGIQVIHERVGAVLPARLVVG